MAVTVDYYLSLMSPWAYLGGRRFKEILARHGAKAVVKPVDFHRIFAQSGGLPLGQRAPQRRAYRLQELRRWREHLGVPLNIEARYVPADTRLASSMVIAGRREGHDVLDFTQAIMAAAWAEERNVADEATLIELATRSGLDGRALRALADDPAIAAAFEADTQEAIDRQLFGAPSYVVGTEIFWGQDRLDFLDRHLAKGG
jgi:2-hydroxychromene-2-carboxylate isomerase